MTRRLILTVVMMVVCMSAWGQMTVSEAQKKANAGDAEAQFALAGAYINGYAGLAQSYTEAVKWLRKAAAQGHAEALYSLYICYSDGLGVQKNDKEAWQWLLKSAEKNFARAQFSVGLHYEDGEGVSQSYTEAAKWYKKAADQGYTDAILNLGVLYYKGLGVEQSDEEAENLFLIAAEKGDSIAMYDLGLYYSDYLEDELATTWFRKAAEKGHVNAMYELSWNLWADAHTIEELEEALMWCRKAKDLGDEDAEDLIQDIEDDIAVLRKKEAEKKASEEKKNVVSTTPSYTPSYSPSYSSSYSHSYRKHSFNTPYWDERPWGLSIGYVQKYWSYRPRPEFMDDYGNIEERYGAFSDEGESTSARGIQLGLRYEPQFGGGFGINTGLFYEYYTDHSMDYIDDEGYDFKSIWEEHSLNIPLHLEFRANFDEGFQLFAYGGASVDLGLSSTYKFYYYDDDWTSDGIDAYGREYEMLRYNASWEAGAGVRFNSLQIQAQMSRGLIDMAEHGSDYVVFQNKPLTISISWMF